MGPGEFWSSVGICRPLFELVSSLDQEPLQWRLPLLDVDPTLLEWDSFLHLSCIVCKALSLLASRSRYSGSLFRGSATSTCVSVTLGVWIAHSTTFRVSGSSFCALNSGGGGRVCRPDFSLAWAIRTWGSNWGLDRGGSWETRTPIGTLNMSCN